MPKSNAAVLASGTILLMAGCVLSTFPRVRNGPAVWRVRDEKAKADVCPEDELRDHTLVLPDNLAPWELACPCCRTSLGRLVSAMRCASCGTIFRQVEGIWHFLPEERAAAFATFLGTYQTGRAAEGWGAAEIAYYRALPHVAGDDPQIAIWRLRERTFGQFVTCVVQPLTDRGSRPLRVLDVGAGNGWVAYQLARRGHQVAAVDLSIDDRDGLGALIRYGDVLSDRTKTSEEAQNASSLAREVGPDDRKKYGRILPLQAEFDRLPIAAAHVDLVIFNAALHYATDYLTTVSEALRVLRTDGTLVILDSPVYHDAVSGHQMLREREASFERTYGAAWTSVRTEGFLTYPLLAKLATTLNLQLVVRHPLSRWRSILRGCKTRLRGQREPAGFPLILLRRSVTDQRSAKPNW
jgi:SAM-dependent methyltransferase